MVDADALGLMLVPEQAKSLADLGQRITRAANDQLGFAHPELPNWAHISFCLFATQPEKTDMGLNARHAVRLGPGKIDRSPTGTAICARMALLRAQGRMDVGQIYAAQSIIGSEFEGCILEDTSVGGIPAIVPQLSGQAWIMGTQQRMLDPTDPWPRGYRVSDTWPSGAPKWG